MKYLAILFVLATNVLLAQPNYDTYNAFLQKNVSASGAVNYKNIKKNKADLEKIVALFAAKIPDKTWAKNEQLTYWLNAYNLFTIKLIADNYPVKKITDLDNGKPWDVKRIELGGQKYSLNQIENDIIRPTFKDARIHFAINCAAKSCPPLLNKAFTAANVQLLLEQRTKSFVTSKANVLAENSVKVSKIFDWYKADFGDLNVFLAKYATVKIAKNAAITYADYDWNLNE
jgi:hypothetical protein